MVKFERRTRRIWVALVSPRLAFRIAPEEVFEEKGAYRLDRKTLSFEPWEAVTSQTFRTKAEAVDFAKEWLAAQAA